MRVTLYVEGGGDGDAIRTECRNAFRAFFQSTGLRRMPKIVACGHRQDALKRFAIALQVHDPGELPMLLIDTEGPVRPEHRGRPWDHLESIANGPNRLSRPDGATDEQTHLMVQCMEAWFLADRDGLARFFGQGFQPGALPGGSDPEQVPIDRIYDCLSNATRRCRNHFRKRHNKGSLSFKVLAALDPAMIEGASFHAARLIRALRATLGGGPP